MHLNRQIILLFFLSSIVNRQSSIVKVSSIVKAWRVQGCRPRAQGSSGPGQAVQVKRSKGPRSKGQAVQGARSSQGPEPGPAAGPGPGPTAGPNKPGGSMQEPGPGIRPKGIYISHAAAPQKIDKKI